jgi:hypothetical protein
MKKERILEIIRTFNNAQFFLYDKYFYTKKNWAESSVKAINAPLARAYIEKINYPWKFPDHPNPYFKHSIFPTEEERLKKQKEAREYIEKINYPWKFPK